MTRSTNLTRAWRRSPATRRAAFTLTEILLVMAVIMVVAAVAVPTYRKTLQRERLRKGAEMIREDWIRTRTEAMRTGSTFLWVCSLSDSTFSASDYALSSDGGLSSAGASTGNGFPEPDAAVGLSNTLPEGVSIHGVLISEADSVTNMREMQNSGESGLATIFFHADGSSSSARITVSDGDNKVIAVVLNGLSGTMRIVPIQETTPQ